MQVLKSSAPELFKLAASRAERSDVLNTATWQYRGEGRTIILVHGFRGDHHGLSAIAGALDNHHVVIPDLPGYGKSSAFSEKHDLAAYGQWCAKFAAEFENPVVLGHSFGSLVVAKSWEFGMRQPTVLLNPISTTQGDSLAGKVADLYYKLGSRGLIGSALLRSTPIVRGMSMAMATTWDLKLRSFIHDQHHRYFSNYTEDRVILEGYEAASSGNVQDFVDSRPAQLLLIAGAKDMIAPLPGQLELQAKTQAELRTLDCGHLTHYETPLEVGIIVRDFVRDIS
jgi:pimeloyl-ACP methyl ester carboxylesterase